MLLGLGAFSHLDAANRIVWLMEQLQLLTVKVCSHLALSLDFASLDIVGLI